MPATAKIVIPLSRKRIVALTLSAGIVAALVLLAGVLPAELGQDPLRLGRLTGISALWSQPETKIDAAAGGVAAQRSETIAYRSDVIRIPLAAADDMFGRFQLEYKVRMKKGSTLVYSWSVPDLPADAGIRFWTELHGHTLVEGKAMTVVDYRKATGASDAGALTAALDGVHGWYMKDPARKAVTVELRLAGFYALVPPGEPGNEGWIVPVGMKRPSLPE